MKRTQLLFKQNCSLPELLATSHSITGNYLYESSILTETDRLTFSNALVAWGCSSDVVRSGSEVVWDLAQINTEVLCTRSPSASLHPQMYWGNQTQETQPW